MKLKEMGCRHIYFKKEKDKFEALYGNGGIGKAGFSTQAGTRAQILTKLEEVIRNDKIAIYSSRLIDELKTFIWNNGKAQAQRGANDDLVMALAIGVWLYDSNRKVSTESVDINAAMLAGFALNNRDTGENKRLNELNRKALRYTSKGWPIVMDPDHPALSGSADFKWLI